MTKADGVNITQPLNTSEHALDNTHFADQLQFLITHLIVALLAVVSMRGQVARIEQIGSGLNQH